MNNFKAIPLMQGRVQQLLQELCQDPNIKKIVLFGSSLEFRCSSYSDVDLTRCASAPSDQKLQF